MVGENDEQQVFELVAGRGPKCASAIRRGTWKDKEKGGRKGKKVVNLINGLGREERRRARRANVKRIKRPFEGGDFVVEKGPDR